MVALACNVGTAGRVVYGGGVGDELPSTKSPIRALLALRTRVRRGLEANVRRLHIIRTVGAARAGGAETR